MLVLTRKTGQALTIGETVEVIVLEVHGDSVRIGIRAPRDVSIVRREVLEAITQANQESVSPDPSLVGLPLAGASADTPATTPPTDRRP